jgi:uncharacterized protein YjeT (DUF2065 family)
MLEKILGGILLVAGFFVFALGPAGRLQVEAFGRTARLVGLAMMVAGIVLLKW